MSSNKTQPTEGDPRIFIASVENETRRNDAEIMLGIMEEITGEKPMMWGPSLIGYGTYHYKYDSGREGDFFMTGFSPRKQNLVVYVMPGFKRYEELMANLGKHKTGKSCLYINKLRDVDMEVLKTLIREGFEYMKNKYH
jgi:hypothetical protein